MKLNKVFITLLCCGRVELLDLTLKTFIQNCIDLKKHEIHVVVSDDSEDLELNSKIEEVTKKHLNKFATTFSFRFGKNVGQAASYWKCIELISRLKPNVDDVVLLLEEDWQFISEFSIIDLKNTLKEKILSADIASITLKCDVDNFHDYQRFGYNLVKHEKYFIYAPNALSHLAYHTGDCVHNEIICFHPHAMLWNNVKDYIKKYEYENLIHIKNSAERLLGLITPGLRVFFNDKIYANHTGDYRIISVFPGAKIRAGVKIVDLNSYKKSIGL